MPGIVAERKRHVQTLRDCARACGIPLVRDGVGHDRVRAFAAAIAGSGGAAREKAKARDAYRAYEAAWQPPELSLPVPQQPLARVARGQV